MSASNEMRARCSQKAMFVLDVTATVLIVMAFMLLTNDEMGPGVGGWVGSHGRGRRDDRLARSSA